MNRKLIYGRISMNLAAIRHFSTSRDCYCLNPGHFLFRIQAAKEDLAAVILHYQDKNIPLRIMDTRAQIAMQVAARDTRLDYWETELTIDVLCLRYWFELIDTQGKTVFYSNYVFSDKPFEDIDEMFDCPQNLREEERFATPGWAENKVVYQIFPSRFASSREVPDALWYKEPISFRDNLHGDLRGIITHLDHLRELGVDILYMTPIFRSDSCHKYDTIDYYTIDPSFGTKEDLQELVEKAHEMGMRVILDGVFNHTSREFFAFADIQKNEWNSKYLDWYFIEGFPLRANYGEKPNFKSFAYYGGMPKLNVKNPEVTRYILDVALYWLRECHIDGWRLDVGDEISHRFWRKFREAVKAEFPDALIVGEIWHYAEDFLQGDEWDTVMNYPFYQNVIRLVAKEEIGVSEFAGNLGFLRGQLHRRAYPLLWNLVDSHDTPRLLHQCGGSKQKMKLAAALQLLLPGMPMIYYGDEYAMDGGQDPDCRRGMLWDPKRQDAGMFAWYQSLIRVRKQYPQILGSGVKEYTDENKSLLIRSTEVNGHKILLVFHCGSGEISVEGYAGHIECITRSVFSGTLGSWEAAVFAD